MAPAIILIHCPASGATPEPMASRFGRARGVDPPLEIVALGRGCGKLLLALAEVGAVLLVARSSDELDGSRDEL